MSTAITYTNHNGESIEFGGSDESLNYLAHGLRSYKWSYQERAGRIEQLERKSREVTFPIGIATQNGEDGIELRNTIYAITDADPSAEMPGTIEIEGYKISCYVVGAEPTHYWMDERYAEFKLTVLFVDGIWTRETLYHFTPEMSIGFGSGIDFPFEFPFDFAATRPPNVIVNQAMGSGPFVWRVFGPARDPYFRSGDDTHQVFTALKSGEILEVDSRPGKRTAIKRDIAGEVTNVFDNRLRGNLGSGTYLFEPIPAGRVPFSWDNGYAFDLILIDQTSTPPWASNKDLPWRS